MPRIVIYCTDESVFHPSMFEELLKRRGSEIVAAFFFRGPRAYRFWPTVNRALKYDGWRGAYRLVLHGFRDKRQSSEDLFRSHSVPTRHFRNPNDADCIAASQELRADLILNNQPWLFKSQALTAGIAILNRHTSSLPKYRGIEPVFHALLNGERSIGVAVHSVTTEIDAGNVLAETSVPASKSVFECYRSAFRASAALWDEAITNWHSGSIIRRIDPVEDDYCRWPTWNEVCRFRELGLRYL